MGAPKAVILLSGGLDSATALAIAKSQGFELHAISFDYGQRHRFELAAAQQVANAAQVASHVVFRVDTAIFQGSALTNDIPVPHNRGEAEMSSGIPVTYVPARNTIFLSVALGLAESLGACNLFLGVNAVDYSGYPDCRPEFVQAFEQMANLATKVGVEGGRIRIHAPPDSSDQGADNSAGPAAGGELRSDSQLLRSRSGRHSCGECDSCQLRLKGFAEANSKDPIRYITR